MNNDYSVSEARGTHGLGISGSIYIIILFSIFMVYFAGGQTIRIVQDPADYSTSTFYPKDSPGLPGDWHWDNFTFEAYIVPDSLTTLYGINCQFQWDPDKVSIVSVSKGIIWDNGFFYEMLDGSICHINAATHGITDYTTRKGDYIAKVVLRIEKPCISSLTLPTIDVRDVDNQHLAFSSVPATIHVFLGDFAEYVFPIIDQTHGDGEVNFGDLTCFGPAYFSTSSDPAFKFKYDIGPTTDGSVFSLPAPDGSINFPDLVVFSLMYGRSSLPKQGRDVPKPFIVVKQAKTQFAKQADDAELKDISIPMIAKSRLNDVRALEFSIPGNYADAKHLTVELSPAVRKYRGQLFCGVHARNDRMVIDISMMNNGMDVSGELGVIRISGVKIGVVPEAKMVEARNGLNVNLLTASLKKSGIPSILKLYPNFPNPFNPTTTIRYFRPVAGATTIRIVSLLGEIIYSNERFAESEGEHVFIWNGCDDAGRVLSSGMYLFQVETEVASATSKIMLIK
jgi:hypothetical protein